MVLPMVYTGEMNTLVINAISKPRLSEIRGEFLGIGGVHLCGQPHNLIEQQPST